jgi:NADPH:quinone reductase-like Zn-dependent oxidoreductase
MKTSHRLTYMSPESISIREVSVPAPKANELLIRVHLTTVNRTDCGVLSGEPYIFRFFVGWPSPRHKATGTDFAGTVEAVGGKVTGFKMGDRVFGFNDHGCGSHAEYFTYPANGPIGLIPKEISFNDAVASLEGAHYALNFIRHAHSVLDSNSSGLSMAGKTVMVYGATGAIGSAAVQLLLHFGAKVTAVCARQHVQTVQALGPQRVIDYLSEDFTQCGEQFDFMFDAVGKSSFGACRPLLGKRGVYLSSELGPGNENLYLPLLTKWRSGPRVLFPIPMNIPRTINLMSELLASGEFRPLIDRTYTLEQLPDAFRYTASEQKLGNVLLSLE